MKNFLLSIPIILLALCFNVQKQKELSVRHKKAGIGVIGQTWAEMIFQQGDKVVEKPPKPTQVSVKKEHSGLCSIKSDQKLADKQIIKRIRILNLKGSCNSLSFRKRIIFPFHEFV